MKGWLLMPLCFLLFGWPLAEKLLQQVRHFNAYIEAQLPNQDVSKFLTGERADLAGYDYAITPNSNGQ